MSAYADPAIVAKRSGVTYADLGLADQAALDAFTVSLNNRAGDLIDRLARRDFAQHTSQVELYDGNDAEELVLRGWPVISIATVKDAGVALAATAYRLKPARGGRSNAGILQLEDFQPWTRSWNRWEVTYTWGYAAVPLDIQNVAENLLVRYLQAAKADKQAAGVQSWSMNGFSTTYDRAGLEASLSDTDMATVAAYRAGV